MSISVIFLVKDVLVMVKWPYKWLVELLNHSHFIWLAMSQKKVEHNDSFWAK